MKDEPTKNLKLTNLKLKKRRRFIDFQSEKKQEFINLKWKQILIEI